MAIESKELQQEVNVFLKDSSSSYHEILENIHADNSAQTTCGHMKDTSNSFPGASIIRQGKVADDGENLMGIWAQV